MADKKTVYDSILSRMKSGRDNHTKKELREFFEKILEQLNEQQMLTSKGKEYLYKNRLPREFKLTSEMVNDTGEKHLDRMYKIHMRKRASALSGFLKEAKEDFTEKGKRNLMLDSMGAKVPLMAMMGAGYATGYDKDHSLKAGLLGGALGATAGAGLGAADYKIKKKFNDAKDYNERSNVEQGARTAVKGGVGYLLGKSLGKDFATAGNYQRNRNIMREAKEYAEEELKKKKRNASAIDI